MKNKWLKKLTGTLALGLLFTFLIMASKTVINIRAAETAETADSRTVRTLNLNVNGSISGLTDPAVPKTSTYPLANVSRWEGSKVYFGSFDADTDGTAEPILFRVLDAVTTDYGEKSIFLDCDTVLTTQYFDYHDTLDATVHFTASALYQWLNGSAEDELLHTFSLSERTAIMPSIRSTASGLDSVSSETFKALNGEKVFIPDARELSSPYYGYYYFTAYYESGSGKATRGNMHKEDASGWYSDYWLRNNTTVYNSYSGTSRLAMYTVTTSGLFEKDAYYGQNVHGVSPALNLSLDSVLFTGTCGMDKTTALSAVNAAAEGTSIWTLTLKDTTKSVALQEGQAITQTDNVVTVPYTYIGSDINQISVMITSSARTEADAEILYYGRLETTASFTAQTGNGTGTFTLPVDLPEGCQIYLLAEHISEGNYTDSASEPVNINDMSSTSAPSCFYSVTVNNGSGNGSYAVGTKVVIQADTAPEGQHFDQWTVVSGDVTLFDADSNITYFIMPEDDVEVAVTYKHAHTLSSELSHDENFHWYACDCGYKGNSAFHTESDWIIDVTADNNTIGKKHTECTVCGQIMQAEDIYIAPSIITQPQSVTVGIGETAVFTIEADGNALSYQWQYSLDSAPTKFIDLEGATGSTYSTVVTDLWCHVYRYRCIISNELGKVTSSAATIEFQDARTVRTLNLNVDGSVPGLTDPAIPTRRTSPPFYGVSSWEGTKVYFGSFDADTDSTAEPILFRVLDAATTDYGGESIFLDCDTVLTTQYFDYHDTFDATVHFTASSLCQWLNGSAEDEFLHTFSLSEKTAIMPSARNTASGLKSASSVAFKALNGEKVFIPDANELSSPYYGYDFFTRYYNSYDKYTYGNMQKKNASRHASTYWLRSNTTIYNSYSGTSRTAMYIITSSGTPEADVDYGQNVHGVSPALNLSLDSVLFTGTCGMDKTTALSAVNAAAEGIGIWTLTLKDVTKSVALQEGQTITQTGNVVTVPYTYTGSDINQISVMITSAARTEADAEILYYGRLETTGSFTAQTGSGTGIFTLPENLPEGCQIYLLAEHITEGNYTDSASEPYLLALNDGSESGGETDSEQSSESDSEDSSESGSEQSSEADSEQSSEPGRDDTDESAGGSSGDGADGSQGSTSASGNDAGSAATTTLTGDSTTALRIYTILAVMSLLSLFAFFTKKNK